MACTICYDDFEPFPSERSSLVLGPCGHASLCLTCATKACSTHLAEFMIAGGLHSKGYIAPHLARSSLPGLLCPVCCGSPAARQTFSAEHWRRVSELRAKAKRGVSWRVAVGDPATPWSASFYDKDNALLFRLASPEAAGEALAPSLSLLSLPAPQELDITLGEDGFHVWSLDSKPVALAALAAPHAPAPRRVSFTGSAALGAIPRPPTLLPCFVSPTALATMTAFATTPAAAKLGITPFHPIGLQGAEQALLLLSLFLSSLAREHSNAPYGGALVGSLSLSSGGGGSGSGSGSATPGGLGAPTSPTLQAPLMCPHDGCGAVLSVDLPPFHDPDVRGVHFSCTQCLKSLCGSCGLPWDAPGSIPISHAGASCAAHALLYSRLSLGDVTGEEGLSDSAKGAVKRCPVPTCGALIFRYRGHACHSVTCSKCHTNLCYVCLATNAERSLPWHAGCPGTCDDTCDCVPCPDCATGRPCDHCDGSSAGTGCTSCKLGRRPETEAERAARLARQAQAVKAHLGRYPKWPGPRRFRVDVPEGSSARAPQAEDELAFRFGRRPAPAVVLGPGSLSTNIWLTSCFSRNLSGPASITRDALQLLDSVLVESGTVSAAGGAAEPDLGERMYLVQGGAGGHTQAYRGAALCPTVSTGGAPEPQTHLHAQFHTSLTAKTVPEASSWQVQRGGSEVHFPYGPITLVTNMAVPSAACTKMTLSFQYTGGNGAWSCGVVPDALVQDPDGAAFKSFLWNGAPHSIGGALPSLTHDEIARTRAGLSHGGSSDAPLPRFPTSITPTSVIELVLDSAAHTLVMRVNSVQQGPVHALPAAAFPMRLGICGHSGTTVALAKPPATAPQRAYALGDKVRLWRPPTVLPAGWGGGGVLGDGEVMGEVVALEGPQFLLANAPSNPLVCALEESLALLQRAGSAAEGAARSAREAASSSGAAPASSGAAAAAARAAAGPSTACEDAQPSSNVTASVPGAGMQEAGRYETGLPPELPPRNLWYSTAARYPPQGSGAAAGLVPPPSALGPMLCLLQACLADVAPSPHARRYALVLLQHLSRLVKPVAMEMPDVAFAHAMQSQSPARPPSPAHQVPRHTFNPVRGTCRICVKCAVCTGYGAGCVRCRGRTRTPGEVCGCGSGDEGCGTCKMCRQCCSGGAAAAAHAPPVPTVPPPSAPELTYARKASRRLGFMQELLSVQGVGVLAAALNLLPAALLAAKAGAGAGGGGGEGGGAEEGAPASSASLVEATAPIPHCADLAALCACAADIVRDMSTSDAALRALGGWAAWLEEEGRHTAVPGMPARPPSAPLTAPERAAVRHAFELLQTAPRPLAALYAATTAPFHDFVRAGIPLEDIAEAALSPGGRGGVGAGSSHPQARAASLAALRALKYTPVTSPLGTAPTPQQEFFPFPWSQEAAALGAFAFRDIYPVGRMQQSASHQRATRARLAHGEAAAAPMAMAGAAAGGAGGLNGRYLTEEEAIAAAIAASLAFEAQEQAAREAAAAAELAQALAASRAGAAEEEEPPTPSTSAHVQGILSHLQPLEYFSALRAQAAVVEGGRAAPAAAAPPRSAPSSAAAASAAAAAAVAGAAAAATRPSAVALDGTSTCRHHACELVLVGQHSSLHTQPNAGLCSPMYRGANWHCDVCARSSPGSIWYHCSAHNWDCCLPCMRS